MECSSEKKRDGMRKDRMQKNSLKKITILRESYASWEPGARMGARLPLHISRAQWPPACAQRP